MKFTREQIQAEADALALTEAQASVYYLRQELRRRERSGRKATSDQTRREQVRDAQRRFRAKGK